MQKNNHQIFYTESKIRWKTFKAILYLSAFFILLFILAGIYSLSIKDVIIIPKQLGENQLLKIDNNDSAYNSSHDEFNKDIEEIRKQNRADFYKPIPFKFTNNDSLKPLFPIRSAFYVNWDIQSLLSLKKNISKLNMVLPELFFIQDSSDEVFVDINETSIKALNVMKAGHVTILAMVSNFFNKKWNGNNVRRIIHDKKRKKTFINSLLKQLGKYKLHGVNIDIEDLHETTDEYIIDFQKDLSEALHKNGYLLTQDVSPFNEDYNYKELSKYNDLIFLMAYDQHNMSSKPGPISSIDWVENALDESLKNISSSKVVLCLAAYGYDWPKGYQASDITYQEAMTTAKESDTIPFYNNNTYNLNYTYWDDNDIEHEVYFTDAATSYNIIRSSHDFGTAGVALWRLGSEDERIWRFYNQNLNIDFLNKNISRLDSIDEIPALTNVDYNGEGEILNILSSPSMGVINFEYDSTDKLISEERYKSLPSGYVIKKSGNKDKKIVLSFDDGPDNDYTNKIIDILEKYKIPASFFVTGINIQANLPTFIKLNNKGYEIGNHTYTHANLEESSIDRTKLELRSTRKMIEAITGRSTILFRPPFSVDAEPTNYSELKPLAIGKEENYIYVGAAIDTRDWEKNVSADTIYERAISKKNIGNIILLHDAGGNREQTILALPRIIEYYKKNGYTFTTIANLLNKSKDQLMPPLTNKKEDFLNDFNYSTIYLIYYSEYFIYSIFLIALFLTAFRLLVIATLATKKHIRSKKSKLELYQKSIYKVSVIVPCFNEEVNIVKTVEHLLDLSYQNKEIIIIDDGSTDKTLDNLITNFRTKLSVKIYSKPNGGKADSINFGIDKSTGDILFCIDADTIISNDAIEKMLVYFEDEKVAAVAGNVKVGNKINLLTNWQSIEYITSQNFDRMAFDVLNGIMVVPGAIGMFRKKHVMEVGLFSTDTLAEDCDLTLKLLAKDYKIKTCNQALAFTEAPDRISSFIKQRRRWSYGIIQSFWKHRKLLFSFRKPNMGWVVLPNILIFQMILPLFNPLVDIILILSLLFGKTIIVLILYLIYMIVDMLLATVAYAFEGESINYKVLAMMIPQRIIYRQLFFYILFITYKKIIKGELQHWGIIKRTGMVKSIITKID